MSSGADDPLPEDLDHADELLAKAEALMRRHEARADADALDDLPVLTDVVEVEEAEPDDDGAAVDEMQLAEQLIALDAGLTRAIETWMNTELPQIVAREIGADQRSIGRVAAVSSKNVPPPGSVIAPPCTRTALPPAPSPSSSSASALMALVLPVTHSTRKPAPARSSGRSSASSTSTGCHSGVLSEVSKTSRSAPLAMRRQDRS